MCNVINYRGRKWKQSYFLYHSWIFSAAVLCGQLVGWELVNGKWHTGDSKLSPVCRLIIWYVLMHSDYIHIILILPIMDGFPRTLPLSCFPNINPNLFSFPGLERTGRTSGWTTRWRGGAPLNPKQRTCRHQKRRPSRWDWNKRGEYSKRASAL